MPGPGEGRWRTANEGAEWNALVCEKIHKFPTLGKA